MLVNCTTFDPCLDVRTVWLKILISKAKKIWLPYQVLTNILGPTQTLK